MSFPRYPEYKDSGVEWLGEVPAHWEVEDLKYRCEIIPSNVDKKSHYDELPVHLCNYTDVYYNTCITSDLSFMRATARNDEIDKFQLKTDDVVITKDSETADDIAVPAIVTGRLPGVLCGYHLAIIRARRIAFGPFVKYLFQSHSLRYYFEITARGLTRVGLSESAIGNSEIAWPEVMEQRRIAAFLDHETTRIDALIEEQQRLIELLKEKRQAVISHAVTKGLNPDVPMKDSGVEWLGSVPAHWKVLKVKHVKAPTRNAFVDGPFGSNLKSEHFLDDGDVYVIESGFATKGVLDIELLKQITHEHFSKISRSQVKGGDIVIAKIGARFGMCSILPELDKLAVVSGNSMKLTVDLEVCDSFFAVLVLRYLRERGAIEDIVNMTAQPALSLGEMNNLPFPLPSLEEQREIVKDASKKIKSFDDMTDECEHLIALAQERRSALISAAVTGKIDVRGWQPPPGSSLPTETTATEPA